MVDRERARSLLTVLLVVVGVSVVIGGILSAALFLGASGFDGNGQSTAPPPDGPDPIAPNTGLPTAAPEPSSPGDDRTETEFADTDPTEDPTTEETQDAQPSGFSLEASPTSVGSMEDITLRGTFDGPDGTVLQVQRRLEGGDWEDFPVEATVNNGQFTTTVRSGRTGTNEFRMRDDTGAVSSVVAVAVA